MQRRTGRIGIGQRPEFGGFEQADYVGKSNTLTIPLVVIKSDGKLSPELFHHRRHRNGQFHHCRTASRKQFKVSREDQDKFALSSQKKAAAAIEKKIFAKEIIPLTAYRYAGNEKKAITFDVDEQPPT